jgi:uncharacterized YceG family protein
VSGPPPVPGGRPADDGERARRQRARRDPALRGTPAEPREPREPRPPRRAPRGPGDPPRAPREARRARRPPRTRLTARGRIVLALLALLAIAVLWFLSSLFQPFHGEGSGSVAVAIPRSSGVGEIADALAAKGVVSSAFFFEARATIAGKRSDLKPGSYTLKRDMSYGAAIDALAKGPPPNVVTLVVPEGKSRREIASSIRSLTGDYLAATRRSRLLDPAQYGARGARDLEGFLFPASYELKRGQSVDALVAKQLEAFKQRFATVDLRAAKKVNLTPYDVLIIASLVERETAVSSERGLVASVIYNRLHDGIPLGIDATTRFETGNWTEPLKQSELQTPSPYNTRLNKGLPPGPIGNPGLASIQAAARPPSTHYLFYVANPCKPGTHTFVRTKAEFDAAVAKYNDARARAGGRAPQGC